MRTMVREQWDEGGVSLRRRRCVYGREVAAVVMFPEASLVMAVGGVAASTQHGVGVLCCQKSDPVPGNQPFQIQPHPPLASSNGAVAMGNLHSNRANTSRQPMNRC
jgi:hypothetical protein